MRRRTSAGDDPNDLALYGQDSNGTVWSICVMNMILHNITRFTGAADLLGEKEIMNPACSGSSGGALLRSSATPGGCEA